ncbi:RING-H2 finger protein ATL34-like [Ctenocephalides felis]|uniref:RING-H2 finger protein ATL34-like n=1 Tax=Ctenocephalides felis TaxID=7515 RepID=UPI000E6E227E|nr:RING-H2 finger protein ATL34-like [Ctenocephalides felis]
MADVRTRENQEPSKSEYRLSIISTGSAKIQCTICLSEFEDRSVLYPCLHEYCFKCISEWSKIESTCPLCKADIDNIRHKFDEDGKNYETCDVVPCSSLSSPSRTSSEGDPAASNDPQNQPLNQFLIPSAVIQLLRNDSSTRIPLNESAARILLQVQLEQIQRLNRMNESTSVTINDTAATASGRTPAAGTNIAANSASSIYRPTLLSDSSYFPQFKKKHSYNFPYYGAFLLFICIVVYFTT